MSMSANLHDVETAEAHDLDASGGVLKFKSENGCQMNIFMPFSVAQIVADAFNNPGRVKQLMDATAHVLHDIDDLVANSQGVTGLHQNGDVAEWPDILEGGSFGAWLMSVEVLRNVLTPKPATDEATV